MTKKDSHRFTYGDQGGALAAEIIKARIREIPLRLCIDEDGSDGAIALIDAVVPAVVAVRDTGDVKMTRRVITSYSCFEGLLSLREHPNVSDEQKLKIENYINTYKNNNEQAETLDAIDRRISKDAYYMSLVF